MAQHPTPTLDICETDIKRENPTVFVTLKIIFNSKEFSLKRLSITKLRSRSVCFIGLTNNCTFVLTKQ